MFLKRPWSDDSAVDGKKYILWLRSAAKDELLFGRP